MTYAIQCSLNGLSLPSFVYDQWYGLPYYRSVLHWAKNCDQAFIDSLKRMKELVLGLQNYHLILVCDEKTFAHLEKNELPKIETPQ